MVFSPPIDRKLSPGFPKILWRKNVCPNMSMRAIFWPLHSQKRIILNETNFVSFVPVHYILSVIYSLIHVKLPHWWQKISKNGQNWPYFRSQFYVSALHCVISFEILNFLHEIFRINVKLNFFLMLLLWFLAAKFQNFPRIFWNLLVKFFARPKSKISIRERSQMTSSS